MHTHEYIKNHRSVHLGEKEKTRQFFVKNLPAMQETPVQSWVGKIPWRRDRLPTPVFLSFRGGSTDKESAYNAVDFGSIPGLGRSPGEGNGYPLQYSCLENSIGRRAWQATVHGVAKTRTGLSDFHFIATVQGWGC